MKQLKEFLDFAVTPYHTIEALKTTLEKAGFKDAKDFSGLELGKSYFATRAGTSIFAFTLPAKISSETVFHIAVAHSDFPGLRLAPNCDSFDVTGHTLHPEVYGSPILSTWFDRDLGIAGNIITNDLKQHVFRDDCLCRIPNLAIHLTRTANPQQQINKQEELNALADFEECLEEHLSKFIPNENNDKHSFIASSQNKILSYDARLFDKAATDISANRTLISSGRLDNLLSAEAAVRALVNSKDSNSINIACVFDHEEIGSKSREGAGGNLLQANIAKIWNALGQSETSLYKVFEKSFTLSMDAAHAVHPGHLNAHDKGNQPRLGFGSVLKINANKRYATDVYSEAYFKKIAHDIALQTFVSRNDIACGSTVGPTLSAALGIPTLDIGAPILSMHSIRETAHVEDFFNLQKCAEAVFKAEEPFPF